MSVTASRAEAATADSAVRIEVDGPTAVLTLDNPRRRNALSVATMRELLAAITDVSGRDGVRVIVLRAEGPAFSAGHDLSEMIDRTLDEEREVFAVCTDLMSAVHAVPQPVIAAVQGVAVAAGLPARGDLRPRRRRRQRRLRHPGREDRAVLLDAHGRGHPRDRAQARDAAAAHRRGHRRRHRRRLGPGEPGRRPPANSTGRSPGWRRRSPTPARSPCASARRRSTARSTCPRTPPTSRCARRWRPTP